MYSPYTLPDVPKPTYTPYISQKTKQPQSFGVSAIAGTGNSNSGIPMLIDYMMEDARQNREATKQARQQAIDTYTTREGMDNESMARVNGILDQELSRRTGGDDPFTKALKGNLSSVMNNPEIYSQGQIDQFVAGINSQNDRAFDRLSSSINNAGSFNSGNRIGNLANARASALADASGQTLNLRQQLGKMAADRQMSAMDIGSRFQTEENNSLNQLFGIRASAGQADADIRNARTKAIADLLGGTIYNPNDLSGLIDTLIASRAGMKAGKKGKTNAALGALGTIGGAALGGFF